MQGNVIAILGDEDVGQQCGTSHAAGDHSNAMTQDGALSFVRTLEKQVNFEPLFAAMRRSA